MPEHEPYIVTCSCLKQTIVSYNNRTKEYQAAAPGWLYTPEKNWHCGVRGHKKLESRPQNEPDPKESPVDQGFVEEVRSERRSEPEITAADLTPKGVAAQDAVRPKTTRVRLHDNG